MTKTGVDGANSRHKRHKCLGAQAYMLESVDSLNYVDW